MVTNRVALVTGGAKGIGREICLGLSRSGMDVVVNYSESFREADLLCEEIKDSGKRATAIKANIQHEKEVKNMISDIIREYGKLDVLVNNAGITNDKLIIQMTTQDIMSVLNVNLIGAMNCIKYSVKPMLKNRYGRVVNIASVVGLSGNQGQSNYAASKAGLIAVTKSAAKEFSSKNITFNAVAPGYIDTSMTQKMSEESKAKMLSEIPLGRAGTGVDVAEAVAFLSTDKAAYITGQVLQVDGGMYI
ncbi:3-oxoacyl-[acyl-carrier-protein] reductase [Jeotgalibacillus proteolyticus]|uniref:3-oxoacyl-[acyl-carrier-protein] reductase n=1 Tax=Jeotgalibacillus proteolyticus TaxID=2082395 RepID=A0A2S5G710_9BACL|nr:3-oxoacyl-[acyl-carrier-protein] reductase [Jeotgalibacillus proteolyticus]PPA68711.1 3-oxoacyl-[acyl-carrier-protein] reductase [Jeotgalibacillus proteolyticus]PPA68788.1 3-oxoacyl-[acyl-carrier-protein] reductase [Jeotgalibacillus proteolyticus]